MMGGMQQSTFLGAIAEKLGQGAAEQFAGVIDEWIHNNDHAISGACKNELGWLDQHYFLNRNVNFNNNKIQILDAICNLTLE